MKRITIRERQEREINRLLLECEPFYRELKYSVFDFTQSNLSQISEDQFEDFILALHHLLRNIHTVQKLLDKVKFDDAIQNIATRQLQFYRNDLKPNLEIFEKMGSEVMEILGLVKTNDDVDWMDDDYMDRPVWDIVHQGLACCREDENEFFSAEAIESATAILCTPLFEPDKWIENAEEIEPILGDSATFKIPINIRERLKELYRSFVLGNYIASIALARAILEYTLIDRSTRFGINANMNDPLHPNRFRRLRSIVEDFSQKVPSLKIDMEIVVEAGNRILHPKKKDNLFFIPNYLRSMALESIQSVKKVVEGLYFTQQC